MGAFDPWEVAEEAIYLYKTFALVREEEEAEGKLWEALEAYIPKAVDASRVEMGVEGAGEEERVHT